MGIAYATFCAVLDIPLTLVMPSDATQERITVLQALGAELILSDSEGGSTGAVRIARELVEQDPDKYFYANQYDNPANWQAHYHGTGTEIYAQTDKSITHFLAGMGTSGTLMGAGRYLREVDSAIQIIGVQPAESKHNLPGMKHMQSVSIVPEIYDADFPDAFVDVETSAGRNMVRRLLRNEGLLVGPSAGATVFAALQVAKTLDTGVVVAVCADTGSKYLSDHSLWHE